MQVLVVLAGIAVAGVGFYLLGSRQAQRPVAIGLAAAGTLIAGLTIITMNDDDNDSGADIATDNTDQPDEPNEAEQPTTSDFVPGTTEPDTSSGPVNISLIPDCFDRYYSRDPEVRAADYRAVIDSETDDDEDLRTSDWLHAATTSAIFVITQDDTGATVVGSVRFEYSEQDTLTIHDAVDADCQEVPWEHTGTDLRSSNIAVQFPDDHEYEIVFTFPESMRDTDGRRATIHPLDP